MIETKKKEEKKKEKIQTKLNCCEMFTFKNKIY